MEFKRYSSIENHYRRKFIDKMLEHNPGASEQMWVAREKLDGANIQILFSPHKPMQVGKRSGFIEANDSFFDIRETLSRYSHELDVLQRWSNLLNQQFRIFGELYGPGINNRVDYGKAKRIAIFDVELETGLLTQHELEDWLYTRDLEGMLPKLFKKGTLDECLAVDVEVANIEGIVIKPYDTNLFYQMERFIIKKKSESFKDQETGENEPKGPTEKDEMYDLNQVFRKYITKNRVLDVCAKRGPITEMKQIGEYIILVLEDAKVDFLKDNELGELTTKQEKAVYNVGVLIVNILKELLSEP